MRVRGVLPGGVRAWVRQSEVEGLQWSWSGWGLERPGGECASSAVARESIRVPGSWNLLVDLLVRYCKELTAI